MPKLNLYCTCAFKDRTSSENDFVGLRYEEGNLKIHFPLGYFKNEDALRNISEEDLRDDVLTLFSVLGDSSLMENCNQKSMVSSDFPQEDSLEFPMRAYLNVIRNFIDFGYYREREIEYRQGAHGKVSWGRTIKNMRPIINEENDSVVYLKMMARHIQYSEDRLITQIHKFCVLEAIQKLGFLFNVDTAEDPQLTFEYELFRIVIQTKISKTFNDRHLSLFSDLQKMVEYMAGHLVKDNKIADQFYYGVEKFAPVWEAMIDRIFGNLKSGESKDEFYPHCHWVINEKNLNADLDARFTMRPDTIMRHRDSNDTESVFILDSKYYKYGIQNYGLPTSESINKQLAYAEFVEQKKGIDGLQIYNAFLLPFCLENVLSESVTEKSSDETDYKITSFGYAYGDWKIENQKKSDYRPYHRIVGIYLDTRSVMKNYNPSRTAQNLLAEIVKKVCK